MSKNLITLLLVLSLLMGNNSKITENEVESPAEGTHITSSDVTNSESHNNPDYVTAVELDASTVDFDKELVVKTSEGTTTGIESLWFLSTGFESDVADCGTCLVVTDITHDNMGVSQSDSTVKRLSVKNPEVLEILCRATEYGIYFVPEYAYDDITRKIQADDLIRSYTRNKARDNYEDEYNKIVENLSKKYEKDSEDYKDALYKACKELISEEEFNKIVKTFSKGTDYYRLISIRLYKLNNDNSIEPLNFNSIADLTAYIDFKG